MMVIFNCSHCGASTHELTCPMCNTEVAKKTFAIPKDKIIDMINKESSNLITISMAKFMVTFGGKQVVSTNMKAAGKVCSSCDYINALIDYTCTKCGGVL